MPDDDDEHDEDSDGAPDHELEDTTSSAIADPAERKRNREEKSDRDRISRLEEKHDTLATVVYELRGGIKTLVRQGVRRERREVEAAELRLKLGDKAAERRAKWWPKFFGFVIAAIAAVSALLTAYKYGTVTPAVLPPPVPEVRR